MTIFDLQRSPNNGIAAHNVVIKNMCAMELPIAIEKQMIQLINEPDVPESILSELSRMEQLTLSCLLQKVHVKNINPKEKELNQI